MDACVKRIAEGESRCGAIARAEGVRPPPSTATLSLTRKFLRDALGNIGHAAVIPDQKLDLLSSQLEFTMLMNIKLRACDRLACQQRSDRAGHRQDETQACCLVYQRRNARSSTTRVSSQLPVPPSLHGSLIARLDRRGQAKGRSARSNPRGIPSNDSAGPERLCGAGAIVMNACVGRCAHGLDGNIPANAGRKSP